MGFPRLSFGLVALTFRGEAPRDAPGPAMAGHGPGAGNVNSEENGCGKPEKSEIEFSLFEVRPV